MEEKSRGALEDLEQIITQKNMQMQNLQNQIAAKTQQFDVLSEKQALIQSQLDSQMAEVTSYKELIDRQKQTERSTILQSNDMMVLVYVLVKLVSYLWHKTE